MPLNPAEAELIRETARQLGKRARVSIRTNPNVDPRTHPYISTGMTKHKFGVGLAEARELYLYLSQAPEIDLVGVTCHMGSQITQLAPFEEGLTSIVELIEDLRSRGIPLQYLDFGGGLGISYNGEEPPSPASMLLPSWSDRRIWQ
jgi:diaminopimelate decarboxylase